LWNVADGALLARVATQTEFVLPPVFSADGGYVAIAERVEGANPLYSVLRSADASLVASIEGSADAQGWELGPGGRYLALQGPETVVRVLETRRGAELRRLAHEHAVQRLLHASDGARLVTVDRTGAIAAWSLAVAGPNVARLLGRTVTAASVSASNDGRRLAFTRDDGAVAVIDAVAGAEIYRLRVPRSLPYTSTQLSEDGTQLVTQSGAMLKWWSLPSKPVVARAAPAIAMPSALALDRTSDLIGVGLASGQLQVTPVTAAASEASLAFFGHRGPVTAAALNGGRGLAATGGSDGIVRVWDVASGAPTGIMMQPPDAPVAMVALSADGRYVASAAGRVARIAAVEDGRVVAEVQADGAVSAVAFAPDAASIGVGDATGAVRIAPVAAGGERAATRLGSAATALAFVPDGGRLAAADASGAITLLDTASGDVENMVRHWTQPIRWLEFSPDAGTLLAATDAWLHTLDASTPALALVASRLVVWPASNTTLTAISATAVGIAGVAADGTLTSSVLDLAAPSDVGSNHAALVARDWQTAFALRLNDNGEPAPFDP
jgi:WD40 repeat protein